MLGKLTLEAIPYDNPIIMGAAVLMSVLVLVGLFPLFYYKKWTWLWKEYLTTVDHKKIGVMYIFAAGLMLFRGFIDAIMMRTQQVMSVGMNHGYLPPEHYDQIFTAHGVIMIFFMAMPFMFGLFNLAVPLQIGARDVAFPFLNALSFWLFAVGAVLVNLSLVLGDFAGTGWLAYPPLSEVAYSPSVGVDYYIWSVQISGLGSLLSGINFFVTILKMRCPGMTLMRLPVFTWSVLASSILIIIAFPILTVTLALLLFDRYFGMHFFTVDFGGNAMMYVNLIWAWGHPEVYILILPAFGVFSEVVATFCKKRLFGYTTMVWAIAVITILSFIVWLHHFFTMGAGPDVNAVFGITTMIIAIPTGVKIFNWLFTMFRGRVQFSVPMLWTLGFLITFSIGGMTGVLMSVPAADFQLHNSLFLIAHFHNVIIGGVVFGYLAGLAYWFPKIFGFKLNERLGKCAFWCWIVGFYLSFMPLYILGFMGMTRRLYHYEASTGWHPYLVVAAVGVAVILCGIAFQVMQLVVSIKNRHHPDYKDTSGDPWDGRTLEWSLPSPAPFYNFAHVPHVHDLDAYWSEKQEKLNHPDTKHVDRSYEDIHMPRNSMLPIIIGAIAFMFGFAFIWDIQWLIILSGVGLLVATLIRSFDYDLDYYVKASEVEAIERSLGR
ncbi:MAG: cytochrome o ubiquinol oxidase subunit I [Gammaproteobacteria bacterium]|nr:cytochrome o ubiquinol oxidase subunit I [Gammaproteobacteria bacterium]